MQMVLTSLSKKLQPEKEKITLLLENFVSRKFYGLEKLVK